MAPSDIAQYPAPHLAVDVAVVTVDPTGRLCLLLVRRRGANQGTWALPGRFLRERQLLADAVAVTLEEKCGLSPADLRGRKPRQLHLFDDPDRDDRGWVMSMAHLLALPYERLAPVVEASPDVTLTPIVNGRLSIPRQRTLPYGQDEIVDYALEELRRLYAESPDPEGIIAGGEFTLAELHEIHLAVLNADWQIDTFRRHMIPQLVETGRRSTGGVGRPAALYARPETNETNVPSS